MISVYGVLHSHSQPLCRVKVEGEDREKPLFIHTFSALLIGLIYAFAMLIIKGLNFLNSFAGSNRSYPVQRAFHFCQIALAYMRINLRGFDIVVAKQFLDKADIRTVFQQMGSIAMT